MSASDGSAVLALSAGGSAREHQGRLRQIDALRVLTSVSVIACHTIGNVYRPESLTSGVGTLLFHYSRAIFFFVSALVLVRSYVPRLGPDGRLPDDLRFRRRRLRLVGVPYLVWTAVYVLVASSHAHRDQALPQGIAHRAQDWVHAVLTGSGKYHLYFLIVTLEFTVVFPLFLWLLRRTRGRHTWLLICSYVLQLGILAIPTFGAEAVLGLLGTAGSFPGLRMIMGDASLLVYQLWLVAGGLAGLYLEPIHAWLVAHRKLVLGAVPVAAALLLGAFWIQIPGHGVSRASTPFQPTMVVWSTAMLGALYLAADRLSRFEHPLARTALSYGARLSFGVFLAHPLVLDLVLATSRKAGWFTRSPAMLAAAFVLTLVGAVLLCALLDRSRFSRALIGRQRLGRGARTTKPVDPS